MNEETRIRPRERDTILQALGSGVVPRIGQHHIQVGRSAELGALLRDIERIADGGSAFRLVIGEYGAGKTFFLNLVRSIALEKRLVTAHADLNPDRRLHATGGQARALYQELIANLATRSRPDGNGLPNLVERFVTSALTEATDDGRSPSAVIAERLNRLTEHVGGYDFAQVIDAYWRGHDTGDEQLKHAALRWLRGEFHTKTDARQALGVRTIVDDANAYDHLKLLGLFARLAGFNGLLVILDELVNLYKLGSGRARASNYEQILRILNDTLGQAQDIGFVMAGTPDFLLDARKGLYSYPALQTRLAENPFATGGLVDYTGPVIHLANLTQEDLFLLLQKVCRVQASGSEEKAPFPDEGIEAFMKHCSERVGDAYFRTPRSTIKAFVSLLAVLEQNPGVRWQKLVEEAELEAESNPDLEPLDADGHQATPDDDELSTFQL
jgi:P-loop Domain of unknown function (DUF2791)